MAASIINPHEYQFGKLLGKGGFGVCYHVTKVASQEEFACKVLCKLEHPKKEIPQEILIHRNLTHQHVVKLYNFFTGTENDFMLLELCPRGSLHEFQKPRKRFSEDETKYFVNQIVSACKYLHQILIVHRDLKPDNVLLTQDLQVKIGDFGLATTQRFHGEPIQGRCGTCNYMAPEVVADKLYDQQVDVFSVGCIVFTLLVGQPPFKASSKKKTFAKIKRNEYSIPSSIGPAGRNLIKALLKTNPKKRPTMAEVLDHEFLTTGYLPPRFQMEGTGGHAQDGQEDMAKDDEPQVCTYVMTALDTVVQNKDAAADKCATHSLIDSTEPSLTSDGENNSLSVVDKVVEPVSVNLAKRVAPLTSLRNYVNGRLLLVRKWCRNVFAQCRPAQASPP